MNDNRKFNMEGKKYSAITSAEKNAFQNSIGDGEENY